LQQKFYRQEIGDVDYVKSLYVTLLGPISQDATDVAPYQLLKRAKKRRWCLA